MPAFLFDINFWTMLIALIALILSQLPPIHILIKKGKLELEVYESIHLTHVFGNPNLQLFLIINNIGGRKVCIEAIELNITNDKKQCLSVNAKNYLNEGFNPDSQVLLSKIKLPPSGEWSHITNFFNQFNKQDEKFVKDISKLVKDDISVKLKKVKDENILVEVESALNNKLLAFAEKKYFWEPGEYQLQVIIKCKDSKHNLANNFRFTIFESDADDLKKYMEGYKFGEGICFPFKDVPGVIAKLHSLEKV